MQANWSLILNVFLLIGVIIAIGRLMKARRQRFNKKSYRPTLSSSNYDSSAAQDDIIAVRKITPELFSDKEEPFKKNTSSESPRLLADNEQQVLHSKPSPIPPKKKSSAGMQDSTIMFFLLAKEKRQFAGYDLLQTVLAAGLRFGEGNIFHLYDSSMGEDSILCSLAAATNSGTFDLQNIGAFSARGLCLYINLCQDSERNHQLFLALVETARQLSEGLDAYLLDDQQQPLSEEVLARYHRHYLQGHHTEIA